jgi:hypothetical protein
MVLRAAAENPNPRRQEGGSDRLPFPALEFFPIKGKEHPFPFGKGQNRMSANSHRFDLSTLGNIFTGKIEVGPGRSAERTIGNEDCFIHSEIRRS